MNPTLEATQFICPSCQSTVKGHDETRVCPHCRGWINPVYDKVEKETDYE